VRVDERSALHSVFTEKFARPGLEYTLIHTTLDLAIPSFFGILRSTRHNPPGLVVGGAAHPDPVQAALKTLTELVQGLKWLDYRGYDPFDAGADFSNVRSFDDRMRLYAYNTYPEAFEFLSQQSDEIPLSDIASLDAGEIRTNLWRTVALLAECGLEVLAVDVTPVDIQACDLYVTKVLMPELEIMEGDHTMPFLGGRRWRDVPLKLDLTSTQPSIATINPYPHPYP
jgi:thiazole/oxazole-forming peptide maturase SagD family component